MSTAPHYEPDDTCAECGRFGAYEFDGTRLCLDCYEQRGSCCAEREMCETDVSAVVVPFPDASGDETHRVSANCCYEACPRCTYLRQLRDFQARHPQDWRTRLRGSQRAVAAAQLRG